ncbi:hypothetical protein [Paenisporosarcina quisquiliarum]|uniref:hypothetical protein n=1 Tax=Paenisporosarcina quisquiliarum TaxID=365346 RepID=UPI0037370FE6
MNTLFVELFNEYNSIRTHFGKNVKKVNDDIEILSITIVKVFSKVELEEFSEKINRFKIFVNPSGMFLSDYLDEVAEQIYTIEEITELNIQLEKSEFIQFFSNLDYFFFDVESMLKNLSKKTYSSTNPYKLNIVLPEINSFETIFFNFTSIETLNRESKLTLVETDQSYNDPLDFFSSLYKLELTYGNTNPFLYIIKNFHINTKDELQKSIMKRFYIDFLDFISDQSDENNFLIRGNKSLKINKSVDFSTLNYYELVNLFMFLISGEKFLEKITIVKNVFTLYLNDEISIGTFDEKLEKIWKTIQHYFHNYITDDLKDFFKDRDSLFKEAMTVSKSIKDQTDKLYTAINSSLISLVIGVTISAYTSFARDDVFILVVSLIVFISFSVVYYQFSKKHVNERITLIKDQFNHFVDNIYILENTEKETFKAKYLLLPIKILNNVLLRFKYLIVYMNISVFFLFFLLAIKTFLIKFYDSFLMITKIIIRILV